jgi:hypothetical protein
LGSVFFFAGYPMEGGGRAVDLITNWGQEQVSGRPPNFHGSTVRNLGRSRTYSVEGKNKWKLTSKPTCFRQFILPARHSTTFQMDRVYVYVSLYWRVSQIFRAEFDR